MGYDINFTLGTTGRIAEGATRRDLPRGGQYKIPHDLNAPLHEDDLYLYVTFNYSWYFYQTMDGGLPGLEGKTTTEILPVLAEARDRIAGMVEEERRTGVVLSQTWGKGSPYSDDDTNYWSVSARNALCALDALAAICRLAPGATMSIHY